MNEENLGACFYCQKFMYTVIIVNYSSIKLVKKKYVWVLQFT